MAHLSETEKKSDPAYKAECISSMFLDLICTGQTGMVGKTRLRGNKRHNTEHIYDSKSIFVISNRILLLFFKCLYPNN